MSKRREFITLLGGAALAWPLAAGAQQRAKPPRIGFLGLAFERTAGEWLRAGLRDLGYIEGTNIIIEWQWAQNVDELPALAAELVRMHVDVIFAPSSTFVEAARQATTTIPIVFAVHADPVGLGHVAALARPGGNITGTSMLLTELSAKGLEMMAEALPQTRRIGVLWNPTTPSHSRALPAVEASRTSRARLRRWPRSASGLFSPWGHLWLLASVCRLRRSRSSTAYRACSHSRRTLWRGAS
jgi:putative tryptophan/tyrosine transport system substrate-binding protein